MHEKTRKIVDLFSKQNIVLGTYLIESVDKIVKE